jgi:hypothetical protein
MAAEPEQNGKSEAPVQQEVAAEKPTAEEVSDDSEKASEEGSVDVNAEPVVTVKTWIVTCVRWMIAPRPPIPEILFLDAC